MESATARFARSAYRAKVALARVRARLPEPVWLAVVRFIDLFDPPKRALWRIRHGGPPIPRAAIRRRVGSRSVGEHAEVGRRCAEDIESLMAETRRPLSPGRRVLDWGCGSGRVALQLLDRTGVDLHGCDVDRGAIEWLRGAAPDGRRRFAISNFSPPLPWDDESFDVIYSVSVFTHLNEGDQLAWVRELARLLKPGGAALLTTAGPHAFERPLWAGIPPQTAEQLAPLLGRLDELGFVFVSYNGESGERPDRWPGISGDYGLAYQTEAWTRGHWSESLDIASVAPAAVGGYQDAVIAVRPA